MNIRKGQWVSVKDECFVRLKKNGIKGVNNKFKVSKGTNKENGFVFDKAYTSVLNRAIDTLMIVEKELQTMILTFS